jgi:ubiquitin-protein ligase
LCVHALTRAAPHRAAFLHGDIVARAEDTLGQTGIITGLRIELQLRVCEGDDADADADGAAAVSVLRGVRASRVRHVRALHAGDHVLRGAWLGRVEECCDTLLLRLDEGAGGGLVRVEHCTRERVAPRQRATLFHDEEDCPYFPGQRVRAAAGSVLRAGRWLAGGWRGRLDATVLAVEPGEARVRWLAAIGGAAVLAPAPPEEIQKTAALQRLGAFDDSTWQIGDRALISRRELNALLSGDADAADAADADADAQGGAGGGGGGDDDEMEEAEEEGGGARAGSRRRGSRRRSRRGAAAARRARGDTGADGADADAGTDGGAASTAAAAAAAAARAAAPAPPSDVVALVTRTATFVEVLWQDATRSEDVPAATLVPITHLVEGDFWPDEFVLEKRDDLAAEPLADAAAPPQRLGLLASVDPRQRTARVRWLARDAAGRAVLPPPEQAQAGTAEVMSTFDLEPAVEYAFRQGDVVLILDAPTPDGAAAGAPAAAQPPPAWWVGEVIALASGRLCVAWADGRVSEVAPEEVYAITRDDEDDGGDDGEDDDGFGFGDADGEGYWDDAAGAWVGGEGGEEDGSSGWETDDGAEGAEGGDDDEEGGEGDDSMDEEEEAAAPPPQLPRGAAAAAAARALASALAAAPPGLPQGWVDDSAEAQWRTALTAERAALERMLTGGGAAAGAAAQLAAAAPEAAVGGAPRAPLPAAARQLLARVANSFWSGGAGAAAGGSGAPAVGGIRAHLEAQRAARAAAAAATEPAAPTPAVDASADAAAADDDADDDAAAPAPVPAAAPPSADAASSPPLSLSSFAHFDSVSGAGDHYYFPDAPPGGASAPRAWARAVRREWDMLQAGLPGSIWVRVYEERMDLLRVAIAGADDTPYADHLLFFDFQFPPDYPAEPPAAHYHAHGLRPNPNLYANGKVCLSLLGTWAGKAGETWQPGRSTALQVLLSLQALVLVAQPYYNEAGWAGQAGSDEGERNSGVYNEQVCLVLLRTALAALRAPPMHFGELLRAHYAARGPALLARCEALAEGRAPPQGAQGAGASGSAAAPAPPPPSDGFRASLRKLLPSVRAAFAALAPPDAGAGAGTPA